MGNQTSRKVMDAKDLDTGELVYFASHAQATYMSDGSTVENAISNMNAKYATKEYLEQLIEQHITKVLNTPI